MEKLRYRQIHLDFHTSGKISEIGVRFDKNKWQRTLQSARINSITCFSSCHHGWSYHPTKVGKQHPHLQFNLLREQMNASKEIGINVPVYMTAGLNDVAAVAHPEWRELVQLKGDEDIIGFSRTSSQLHPGFRKLCFNSPYLDYLCAMIRETVEMFPEGDGMFLDIINQGDCVCNYCLDSMEEQGYDPERPEDRSAHAAKVLDNYYLKTTAAVRTFNPEMRVFHNSGHIQCGNTRILSHFSHLELESLPTGGWGYDHFPMSAAYARKLPLDFLGMTGKFHTTWGEFGGFKHPNALRYECAAMLAFGAKCSIGDQLHPSGELDASTYALIGQAYAEVEAKEPWCESAVSCANTAILSSTATNKRHGRGKDEASGEIGVGRLLLESHIPFDLLDDKMPFAGYQYLVIPDDARLAPELQRRILRWISEDNGKVIIAGKAALDPASQEFWLELDAELNAASSPYFPEYALPGRHACVDYISTPMVIYSSSVQFKVKQAESSLGQIFYPYFNRSYKHFCSHQHAPFRTEPSGFDLGIISPNILYFAHDVFSAYRCYGESYLKDMAAAAIHNFMGDNLQISTNLPSYGRVNLTLQSNQKRYVLHALEAPIIPRGGSLKPADAFRNYGVEIGVVEDIPPLYKQVFSLKLPRPVTSVVLQPENRSVPFQYVNDRLEFTIDEFSCHAMIELNF
jgi:hypothetical protein